MGGWNIFFALINFAILAFLLVKFGKKTFIDTVEGNRRQISQELDAAAEAAENARNITATLDDIKKQSGEKHLEILEQARERSARSVELSAQSDADMVMGREKQTEHDVLSLRQHILRELKNENIGAIIEEAARLLRGDGYAAARAAMPERFVERLEQLFELTASDRAKLRWGGKLNASLTGADEIDPALAARVSSLLKSKAGEQAELELSVDSSLIGGLRFKLEDSVYDGSFVYMLHRLSEEMDEDEGFGDDISVYFEKRFSAADNEPACFQVGRVLSLADGICRISGLADVMAGEMLKFDGGLRGMVMDIEKDSVSAVMLDKSEALQEGARVRRTGKVMEVPVGEALIGRVVDALGRPLDGRGPLLSSELRPVESPAPSIISRKPVTVPLLTGIKAIDALVPIGRGQRELIIGDRKTGKTSIAIDTVINQKGKDVVCIYVAIGQKESTVAGIVAKLREMGAMDYSIVVSANASDPATMLYIAPYTGAAMGEALMYKGRHVLIIYDDLSRLSLIHI